ncbi:TolC family protein [Dysgonomonas sp. 25]|uniref:TolC family protein n=1 Tax=Dysgonomonas sp. 25 TaxID=2302933 RepID=UPI0013D24162|nr:TolC family protein [Dysgonomonas sp. 25]NDV67879.1 TolC family protein [Dysgonomonas sp. 25]
MKRFLSAIFLIILLASYAKAQDTIRISLNDAIETGISRSVDAVVARNEYISAYWEYRTYKTELLPEVILNTTLPHYSKSYNSFQNADGSYTYVSNNYNRIDAALSINQNIPLTGGKIAIESSLERLRQNGANSSTHYKSIPAKISFEQPIFGFNRVKWLQRIEPVKYSEAQLKLISQREEIALTAIEHYFNLLLRRINLDMAEQNRKNTEKLYTVAEARHKIGQLSKVDLLQMRASLLKAESALTDARASFNSHMFQLRSFLGIAEEVVLEPIIPDFLTEDIPQLSYPAVLSMALENNSFTQNIRKRMLESSRDISQAKADRWDIQLFASFGMSGQEDNFRDALHRNNWRGDQVINVGIRIPILDWGKGKGKVRVAEANREIVQSQIEKEQIDFNQDIFLRVQYFNNQPTQLRLARETDQIAQERYATSVEAFILGKIDILNLNDSQTAKDEARRDYINQMFLLWSYYYQIRSLTLHDFLHDRKLSVEYEQLIR